MSVTTRADEHLDSAKDHLKLTIKELLAFLDEDTWGNEDYRDTYKVKASEVLSELIRLRTEL